VETGRILDGERPPPFFDQLDEAVGGVEGELHPSQDKRTYVRSARSSNAEGRTRRPS
jgi:hypothetical protein